MGVLPTGSGLILLISIFIDGVNMKFRISRFESDGQVLQPL